MHELGRGGGGRYEPFELVERAVFEGSVRREARDVRAAVRAGAQRPRHEVVADDARQRARREPAYQVIACHFVI